MNQHSGKQLACGPAEPRQLTFTVFASAPAQVSSSVEMMLGKAKAEPFSSLLADYCTPLAGTGRTLTSLNHTMSPGS